jgi:hypothetical protein
MKMYFDMQSNYNIDDADANSVVKNTRQWKDLSECNVDRFGGHYQLLPHVMHNLKTVPEAAT